MFISEISKTWLILDELETSEERAAFLSYLHSEINDHGTNYTNDQVEIMQQAYNDLKSKLNADEAFTTNLPVWFIPWYELTQSSRGEIEIGSGGFGNVYLAKWLDSDVVVKRLESQSSITDKDSVSWAFTTSSPWSANVRMTANSEKKQSQNEDRLMFEREANIWFHLSHPHVVRLFGACHVGRQPFFVCEYASNGSLDKYLLEHPDEIWTKLHEAALGLLYLHERGIVHCDLKCNNIVVGSDRKAKVTDFGLSLAASVDSDDDKDKSGKNITGAWNWLSPELMLGKSNTPTRESDVFSFGMCIIEALRVVAIAKSELVENKDPLHRIPWFGIDDKATVKVLMKRGRLPDRPIGCTNAQWDLVEKMCKFNPSERLQMCTVVDELCVLAGMLQQSQSLEQQSGTLSHANVHAIAASVKKYVVREQSVWAKTGHRNKIYQLHELLWDRIEAIQTRFEAVGNVEILNDLGVFVCQAQMKIKSIASHSDSPLDFTKLALQAYDLHRRLDKLLAASFVASEASVNDWKQKVYELFGVAPSVAARLIFGGSSAGESSEQ